MSQNDFLTSIEPIGQQEKKRLGVLGGMGALATAVFYQRLVDRVSQIASCDQDHIDTVIFSDCSLPDRSRVILNGQSEPLLKQCARDFKLLEDAGCVAICFPCNTLHHFIDQLETLTPIPILNMVDITFRRLKALKPHIKRIRVYGTEGTRRSGIYERTAKAYDVEVIPLTDEEQKDIHHYIYELKETGRKDFPELSRRIIKDHQKGIDCVILACTELSCMPLSQWASNYAYDAMDALIDECVDRFALKQNNKN